MAGIFESKKGGGVFQCKGITNAGKHCKIKCNSVFCYHHQLQELPLKETCPICLESIKNKIKIDCKHSFCKNCIFQWLCKNNSCPCCRNINEKFNGEIIDYGFKKKLLCPVTEFLINLNHLNNDELLILSCYHIGPSKFLNKLEWNSTVVFLKNLHEDIFDKLILIEKGSYLKCTPETYHDILNYGPFYLFN